MNNQDIKKDKSEARYSSAFVKKILLFIVLLVSLVPTIVEAHSMYHAHTLIDLSNYTYTTDVINDRSSRTNTTTRSARHLGNFSGIPMNVDLEGLREGASQIGTANDEDIQTDDSYKPPEFPDNPNTEDILPFTFKPIEIDNSWFGKPSNTAESDDIDMAFAVSESVINDLNTALGFVFGRFNSYQEFFDASNDLVRAASQASSTGTGSVNGFTIEAGQVDDRVRLPYFNKAQSGETTLIIYPSDDRDNAIQVRYAINKPYAQRVEGLEHLYDGESYAGDTDLLTWNQLVYYAHYAYLHPDFGYHEGSYTEIEGKNLIIDSLILIIQSFINQIRKILGLYGPDELIFNSGPKGGAAFHYGIYHRTWHEVALNFNYLFQVIAWSMVGVAIAKAISKRNLATVNPTIKANLMDDLQALILTGGLLAFHIPLMNAIFRMNFLVVNMLSSTAPNFTSFGDIVSRGSRNANLGGLAVQFAYLGVDISLNYIYIARALTILLLVATAPLFIVSISFGTKFKGMFDKWIRELVSNLFLQSIHALMLTVYFAIGLEYVRGIEAIVMAFALIPVSKLFKELIFGAGTNIGEQTRMSASNHRDKMQRRTIATVAGGAFAIGAGKKGIDSGREWYNNKFGKDSKNSKNSGNSGDSGGS